MLRRFALVAAALIVCAGVLKASAAQAAITVNTAADSGAAGQCSLRQAIQAANTESAVGDCAAADPLPATTTIIVPAGTYTLASQLEIAGTAKVFIQSASGSGPSQTTIDAAQNSRVLMVDRSAEATLSTLTLTGGRTPNGAAGDCCRPATTTAFDGSPGGDGGGIYNSGALTLTDVVVKANSAGAGGRGGDGGAPTPQFAGAGAGGQGGGGGSGGGVYNDFYGTLTLTNTTVTDNHAGHGGNGGAGGSGGASNPFANAGGAGGTGGSGGGVFSVVGNHVVTLTNATISANTAGDGGNANGGGNGDPSGGNNNTGGPGGDGGAGGDGGGLAVFGPFTIIQSTVSANVTGIGGTGGGGGIGGGGARGGGGRGGRGGTGGGVLAGFTQPSSPFSLTNSTIASNTAAHGGNGGVPNGPGGAGGDGGGVWLSETGTIVSATIAQNHSGSGGFLGGGGAQARDGGGGGLWIQSSQPTASTANTIFASNTIPGGVQNCGSDPPGSVADNGHNLSFPDSTCPGSNGNPALGPLQDNGGPTQTMALGGASAALDQIPPGTASCPAGDQRGVSRPSPAGGLCDIGAFELGQTSPPSRTLTVTTSGTGSGTVTGSGIDCGGAGHTDCSETVADGTTIALNATSAAGSSFTTFTGGGCGAASPCTVAINADKTVDAKFNQLPPNSIVAVTPGSLTPPILTTTPTSPTAPSVTNVTQAHGTWRDGNLLAHLTSTRLPPVGTTFAFALSEKAHVGLAFTQRVGGRRVKGRCVAQTKTNRRKGACQRTVTRGRLSFSGHSGTNRVSFQGRISRTKKLKSGRYTLIVTATNATGQHSSAKALRFTIVN
jgi:CSLREA domain-containing protein